MSQPNPKINNCRVKPGCVYATVKIMRTLLLYRPNSDHERIVLDYMRDFAMQTGKEIPALDVDTPQGAQTCRLYDIMSYPAILVTDSDGRMINLWVGEPLPRISEVSYYVEGGPR